jgi:YidC/Oxa1 family membrane protein insertase
MQNLLPASLTYLVQLFGGNLGYAIIALSLGIRVALLPLTIRLARRALRSQALALAMQPELEELKKRFAKQPQRLLEETRKLHRKHGYNPLDLATLIGGFVQLPIFGMVYSSIRGALNVNSSFLWIRNLLAPNFTLTIVILSLTALSAYFMPSASEHARTTVIIIQLIVTSLIVWKLAAGLGLYWASSNLVGVFQSLWLRYRLPAQAARA